MAARWDFMQWPKHRMHGSAHGSDILQQWQETIKHSVAFVSPYKVPRINMNMNMCHPKYN